jgi:hypothetical protein
MTKQHILQEIKRFAEANEGKPPGRLTFYKATGINENDWSGKYWPRWSDAIREAGYLPNQLTPGYEEDFLISKIIELSREVGHFPVVNEMKMKAYNQRGFPSPTTFKAHFGSKVQIVSRVAEYCRNNGNLEEVLRFCEEASSSKANKTSDDIAERSNNLGVVYLIKAGRFYKIGKIKSIGRRVYDLAIQLAEKPTTVHVIKTDDPDGIEFYWHNRFAAKRKNGEWFD